MSGTDSYYTPSPLADKLTSFVSVPHVKSAIDFCVGDGDLLKAVSRRYKNVKFYGIDISDDALNKLASDCPDWLLSQCDFLDDERLNSVPFLKKRKFDLIVMNPPFTCKGSIIEHVEFEGVEYKVSTAMHFLMRALRYLGGNGGVYAILPISCVYSEKDSKAWKYLKEHYNACILDESERVYFSKKKVKKTEETVRCSPNIVMVYAGHNSVKSQEIIKHIEFLQFPVKDVIRGSIRMQSPAFSRSKKAVKLIHTTNIQKGTLVNLKRVLSSSSQQVNGYGVVIPRVCNPNPMKIALLDGISTYALSDCVIVLRTDTMLEAEQVRQGILENWANFVTIYKGTGAQYTTLKRAKELFGKVETNI